MAVGLQAALPARATGRATARRLRSRHRSALRMLVVGFGHRPRHPACTRSWQGPQDRLKPCLFPVKSVGFQWDAATNSTAVYHRQPPGETEKTTINAGVVDLGHMDLLVQEHFCSNRSDLVRTALRNLLALHADTVKQAVQRRTLAVGLQRFSRADLERAVAPGQGLQVQVVGLSRIAGDVPSQAGTRRH